MPTRQDDFYADIPLLPRDMGSKKKTPRRIAEVDEDNCTGCRVCVPFCPVDCIEPVPEDKYTDTAIPPVHVRHDECIGCELCVRACAKLTWDAIRMVDIDTYERKHDVTVKGPRYGWEGVPTDASIGPTASEMYEDLTKAGKIKFT